MIILLFYKIQNLTLKTKTKNQKILVSAVSDFSELTEAGRPPGSTDVHHCACVHVGRPPGSTGHVTVLSVSLGRPGRSTVVKSPRGGVNR